MKHERTTRAWSRTIINVNCNNTLLIIDQFRYIKIQPKTIDFSTRLWGINSTNSVVIPQSLVLRSIVLGRILSGLLIKWSIDKYCCNV